MTDLARLIVRLVLGSLIAGHGAQKLFGWFEGPGPAGTVGMMRSLQLHPPHRWAALAGLSEFGGGVLTALGALNPLGPLGIIGSMAMATITVHRDKPIWVTAGGAELPVTNLAVATALALVGPGRLSVDHALGIRLPRSLFFVGLLAVGATIGRAVQPHPIETAEEARATVPAEDRRIATEPALEPAAL